MSERYVLTYGAWAIDGKKLPTSIKDTETGAVIYAPSDVIERIAAALNAQAVERNRADLLAEDIEAFHLALDKHGVPRADEAGAVFSMYGRALRLNAQGGVVEVLTRIMRCVDSGEAVIYHGLAKDARAALAAVKGVDRE